MVKSLMLAAIGRVVAEQGCVNNWCSVTRKVVSLNSTFAPFDPITFDGCLNFCRLSDGFDCQGFTHEVGLNARDSPEGVCTHYKNDDEFGTSMDVFAYFPIVNVSKFWPETVYTYKQLGGPTTVTGVDQCRDELSASSLDPKFATFGNQACGTKPTQTANIVDGQYVELGAVVYLTYTPAGEGFGAAKATKRYLTLASTGFNLTKEPEDGSYWTWSNGGVDQITAISPRNPKGLLVCLGAEKDLTPVYVNNDYASRCAMGMRGGSPNARSAFGWIMKNTTTGVTKCMGDVTFHHHKGQYDLIDIEEPVGGLCNTQWAVENAQIDHSLLLSRACDAAAFDGAWVDGQPFSPGDFSWYDKMTISSRDNQLTAHTKQGDANVPYSISIDGCSITVYFKKGCDTCIATGALSEGGDRINWGTGFNHDFWTRKNQGEGCCTLFDPILKTPRSLASQTPGIKSSPTDAACAQQFSGRWVDKSKGDFNFSWVPYMELSEGRPDYEVADDTNGRMTAPIDQGSWVLPVIFFAADGMCKLKLCLEKQCPGESYANGTLDADEIHWDFHLNKGKWDRLGRSSACDQADAKYSCCGPNGKVGCAFSPNKAVCDGQFCCDPANRTAVCGLEPTTTTTTLMLV